MWDAEEGRAHLVSPMGPSLRRHEAWLWQDGKKKSCESVQKRVSNHIMLDRCSYFRMDCKAEIVEITLVLHAQQYPIL